MVGGQRGADPEWFSWTSPSLIFHIVQTQSNTYACTPLFPRGRATRWKSNLKLNPDELPLHFKTSQLLNFLGMSTFRFREDALLPQRQPENLFPQEHEAGVPLGSWFPALCRQVVERHQLVSARGASPPCCRRRGKGKTSARRKREWEVKEMEICHFVQSKTLQRHRSAR